MTRSELENTVKLVRSQLTDLELEYAIQLCNLGPLECIVKWRLRRKVLGGRLPTCDDYALLLEVGSIVRVLSYETDATRRPLVGAYFGLLYLSFGLCDGQQVDMRHAPSAFRLVVEAIEELSTNERNVVCGVIHRLGLSGYADLAYFAVLSLFLSKQNVFEDRFQDVLKKIARLERFEESVDAEELERWRSLARKHAGVNAQGQMAEVPSKFSWLKESC